LIFGHPYKFLTKKNKQRREVTRSAMTVEPATDDAVDRLADVRIPLYIYTYAHLLFLSHLSRSLLRNTCFMCTRMLFLFLNKHALV